MLDRIYRMTDLQFITIIIGCIVVAHVACWAFNKWVDGGKR